MSLPLTPQAPLPRHEGPRQAAYAEYRRDWRLEVEVWLAARDEMFRTKPDLLAFAAASASLGARIDQFERRRRRVRS